MARVLFLRRQSTGDIAEYSECLAEALDLEGVEAVIDDAESWIPNKTGWMVDRKVSPQLRRAAQGFDLVHAFGFRSAWACSEAFYVRMPWVYTAFDIPKTTHSHLIDRLNAARRGFCSSRAVRDALRAADALHLEVFSPCVPDLPQLGSQETLKESLGLWETDTLVYWEGGVEPSEGLESLLRSVTEVLPYAPHVLFAVCPTGNLTDSQQALVRQAPDRVKVVDAAKRDVWRAAASLVVCTRLNAGFSMSAGKAMMAGIPVLIRRAGGLDEMVAEGESGFYFDVDSDLPGRIRLLLESPLTLESAGRGGMVRAQDRFEPTTAASVLARTYRDLLER